MKTLILASSSVYRKQLLQQLNLPFISLSPDIDEQPLVNESPDAMVYRLSKAKANAILSQQDQAVTIISSDQVGVCENQILTKPYTKENALKQLHLMNGKTIMFYTGLCVIDTQANVNTCLVEPFQVTLRALSTEQIERYVELEQPYQCAGAFKSEGYGITIIDSMKGSDPNSLIGLPLIKLVTLLNQCGYHLP